MKTVTYPGDHNFYGKYKHTDGKYYVRCLTTTTIDGQKYHCTYRHKREDHHKRLVQAGRIHICEWEKDNKFTKSLLDYYAKAEAKPVESLDYSAEGLKQRLAILIARRNISLDTAASDDFYDFILFCIAFGKQLDVDDGNIIKAAKNAYPHYKEGALRKAIIESAASLKNSLCTEFSQLDFVSVAIDEGSTFGEKNVSFNLENPFSEFNPFTVEILPIVDVTARGYVSVIREGLEKIYERNIMIASCICDGNLAQKKAFSYSWKHSLRFGTDKRWLKEIIFIPCLCHKINNVYKKVVKSNHEVLSIIQQIREAATICKENKNSIGLTCPSFVNTRWIYDFEIANFLRQHQNEIENFVQLPKEFMKIFPILEIFKTLVKIFEDPKTPFMSGFIYLERSKVNFQELHDNGNQFSMLFYQELINSTLLSSDGGLWILGYLLTETGHQDFYKRTVSLKDDKPVNPLHIKNSKVKTVEDELEETTQSLLDNIFSPELEMEDDKVSSDETENPDSNDTENLDSNETQNSDSNETQNSDSNETDKISKVSGHANKQPIKTTKTDDHLIRPNKQKKKKNENYSHLEYEESEESDSELENELEELKKKEFKFKSYLESAKRWLIDYLTDINYSNKSIAGIMRQFNSYIETKSPFPMYRNNSRIGYSWLQIEKENKAFAPIAAIARRLHSSGLSEASCERSISQQRLIFASRRRNSQRDLLDARLAIMSATLPSTK